jgi:tyrosine-protein phosphatase non-receptor type 4
MFVLQHCSAGIGRTGVLILMDTAMALLELQSPIYPLELVQTMRDQRASMVQNSVSFAKIDQKF